ncbi:DUF6691 family protein [Hydrocarboniphaga sp.]|uniref:DUF6691 family protein n=1 Tax=Hydrocarboniphaga sp. TaxID=2033016 RepID=UPI003D11CBA1
MKTSAKTTVVALLAGLVFGAGLTVSGMASQAKVLGFLKLGPGWDPSLMLVMGSALAVTLPGFWWMRRRGRPLLGDSFAQPATTRVDTRLLIGAALFGVGWGLSGFCPGPAIVSLALLQPAALVFLPAMLAGAALTRLL